MLVRRQVSVMSCVQSNTAAAAGRTNVIANSSEAMRNALDVMPAVQDRFVFWLWGKLVSPFSAPRPMDECFVVVMVDFLFLKAQLLSISVPLHDSCTNQVRAKKHAGADFALISKWIEDTKCFGTGLDRKPDGRSFWSECDEN